MLPERYAEGREARFDSTPNTANPYPFGTHDAAEWDQGWMDADDELRAACDELRDGRDGD